MQALIYRAERARCRVDRPGPHQIYRRPRLAIESRPLGPLAADHVRVAVRLAGVCGSDLHLMQCDPRTGYIVGSVPLEVGPQGRVLGHEAVGEVQAVGADVAGLSAGAWVALESLRTCQRCEACRRGLFNQCGASILVGTQADGFFREVVDVPAQLVHDVSDLAASEDGRRAAACLEPAACSFGALTRARLAPGERVLVFGAGPIGAIAALLAAPCSGRRRSAWSNRSPPAARWCSAGPTASGPTPTRWPRRRRSTSSSSVRGRSTTSIASSSGWRRTRAWCCSPARERR
ncbi:MAG: alcohol dehydrogenase catalytic domain-containing protein [Candidatus Binatia bacterium]